MRNPSQALFLAVLMASLILPPVLPAAKAASVDSAQKAQAQKAARQILLVGDSLSIGLGRQLQLILDGQPGVHFDHLGRVSSGLANPAFFDWDAHLTTLVKAQHPDIVLIMVGANDDKPLPGSGGGKAAFGTPAWDVAYAARLSRLHAIIRAENSEAAVYFLGVPVMADPAFDKEMVHVSALIKETAGKLPGGHYIEVRDVLADATGAFAPMARTPDGAVSKLRADDGVHISGTGSRLLAARCLEAIAAPAGLPGNALLAAISDRDARPVAATTLAASPVMPVRVAAAAKTEPRQAAVVPAKAAPRQEAATAYTVADGDTLWAVARRLGLSAEALARANPEVDPRRLTIGRALTVPAEARPATIHPVAVAGETTPAAASAPAVAVATPAASAAQTASGHGHIVAEGDNYWSVARRYDVSVAALTAANPGVEPTRLHIGQELAIPDTGKASTPSIVPAPGAGRYVVADGDNFWSIAHRLGLDVAELTRANAAVDPQKLRPGQVLSLPGVSKADGGEHRPAREARTGGDTAGLYPVAKGDTLWALARRFGVDVSTLLTSNGEVDPSRLQIGQLVTIPGGLSAVSAESLAFPVSDGDTLAGIARRFGISLDTLLAANPDIDPLRLQKGQIVQVPSALAAVAATAHQAAPRITSAVGGPTAAAESLGRAREHTVSSGDTIWHIARRYGISVERILAENGGIDPLRLHVGQTLRLPDSVVAMVIR